MNYRLIKLNKASKIMFKVQVRLMGAFFTLYETENYKNAEKKYGDAIFRSSVEVLKETKV